MCLKSDATGAACVEPLTLDMLWVWTNQNKHLMNVKTLKCIQRKKGVAEKHVVMKRCERNNSEIMSCKMENSNLQIGWKWEIGEWIPKWYLHFSERWGKTYATWKFNPPSSWSSNGNFCKTSENYKGIVIYNIIMYKFYVVTFVFFQFG